MHVHTLHSWQHDHHFLDESAIADGRRRVIWVTAVTAITMVVEIIAGWVFNSMALLADGWHMASHAAALSVVTHDPRPPEHYKALLSGHGELAHVTVEVNACPGESCLS